MDGHPREDAVEAPRSVPLRVLMVLWPLLLVGGWASLAGQWDDLYGAEGLFPLAEVARGGWWWHALSVLSWWPSSGLAWGLMALGTLASVASWVPRWRSAAWAIVAACLWQLSIAGGPVLAMPGDVLVLHGTVALAIAAHPGAHRWGVALLWVIVAKLYAEAGLAKLAYEGSGGIEGWLWHPAPPRIFELAFAPGVLARWWSSVLSDDLLRWGGTLAVGAQLLGAIAVLAGRTPRRIAGVVFVGFQGFLISGTNFGWLGWASLLLALALFDGGPWPSWALGRRAAHIGAGALVGFSVVSALQIGAELTGVGRPIAQAAYGSRAAYRYAMFLAMPPGRLDWTWWVAAPGAAPAPVRMPGQVDPERSGGRALGVHHPRLATVAWMSSNFEGMGVSGIAEGFAHPEGLQGDPEAPRRAVAEARAYARWVCARAPAQSRVSLAIDALSLAPSGDAWWTVRPVARSQPVACEDVAEAASPWIEVRREDAGSYR